MKSECGSVGAIVSGGVRDDDGVRVVVLVVAAAAPEAAALWLQLYLFLRMVMQIVNVTAAANARAKVNVHTSMIISSCPFALSFYCISMSFVPFHA